MLMEYGSQLGNMYYSAIMMDDPAFVLTMEKYGFPKSDFEKSSDPFVRKIIPECKRFRARKLLKHFNDVMIQE